MLGQSLKKGVPYEEEGLKMVHGRESLRANAFYNQLADWESVWIKKAKQPVAPTFGKELTYAQNLLSKYDKLFNEYY
jgi:alpha-N-acetylglucosaminidase